MGAAIGRLWNTPLKIRRDRQKLHAETERYLREQVEETLRLRELEMANDERRLDTERQVIQLQRGLPLTSAELGDVTELVRLAVEEQRRRQQELEPPPPA